MVKRKKQVVAENKHIYYSYFSLDGVNKLLSYLGRVKVGSSDDWRTPFYDKAPREELLNSWGRELIEIKDKYPSLFEFENHLREKVGPLSIMKCWKDRVTDLDDYYLFADYSADKISDEALSATLSEFSKMRGLRIKSQTATVRDMKKSTNSGSPFFTKRNNIINETIPCSLHMVSNYKFEQILSSGKYLCCAVVGWRGQEGGPEDSDVKQRMIWMFAFAGNIEELRVYQPFISGVQKKGLVPAWISMDAVDETMTRLFDTKSENDLIVCTDFTKFDQHFNVTLQECAYDFWNNIIADSNDKEYWLKEVFPLKYNIPIATPDGIRFGHHGMASGSGGTNCDETVVHRTLQHEAAMDSGAVLNPYSQCLGDDGVLSFPGITVDKVISSYTKHGLEMNVSKQYADNKTAEYLRRWYSTDYRINGICRGVYSTYRAIGRLAGQERFYDPEFWSPEMVELRFLSIIENVKWHPLREKFVQWCMKGDKYALGTKLPGFFNKLNHYVKEATSYMDDFLGYTKSLQNTFKTNQNGINDWWIVKYLKSL